MGDSTGKGGFTVTDRRSFSEGADARVREDPPTPPANDAAGPGTPPASSAPTLPSVDFGELEHPDVGAAQIDLPLAKHTIDILVMLEEKTRGNLTPAEEKLIGSLLYDLRLRYLEAQKKPPA